MKPQFVRQLDIQYEQKRRAAREQAEQRYQSALMLTDFAALDAEITQMNVLYAQAQYNGIPTISAQQQTQRLHNLRLLQQRVLQRANYPADYLKEQYECTLCNDTGRINGDKYCACFMRALTAMAYEQSNFLPAAGVGFEHCNFAIFSPEKASETAQSQRERTVRIYQYAKNYCEAFPNNASPNIFITGSTGLGKTYLLECIAGAIIKKGYIAIKLTAYQLDKILLGDYLEEPEQRQQMQLLLDADLLLIDDLGTEPIRRNVSIEGLFNIINERMLAKKHTLIASNLTPNGITERYGDRVLSRLMDRSNGITLQFQGRDVRLFPAGGTQ